MKRKLIHEYVDYLKDNPEGYWFKRKIFGWGWTPATKEGWLVIGIFLIIFIGTILYFDPDTASEEVILTQMFPTLAIEILVLIVISWKKGEPPRWQWGLPDKDSKNDEEDTKTFE